MSKFKPSSPYIWTSVTPHRAGWYWYRMNEADDEPVIQRVFRVPGELEWSVQWGLDEENDVDWCCNERGQWAGPIPEPREPVTPPEVTD